MADSILTVSVIYWLLVFYGTRRYMSKWHVIAQFIVTWLVVELAFFHALLLGGFMLLALLDPGNWSFSTFVGLGIGGYTIKWLWALHQESLSVLAFDEALALSLGKGFLESMHEDRRDKLTHTIGDHWKRPFSFKSPKIKTVRGIVYGPNDRNTLDLHLPREESSSPRPIMLQIHGGGWMIGYGDRQALPLRNKLVEAGWIFVAINYRLSPAHQFPAHVVDCKRALYWIKENIAEYGGDPDFVLVTGGSAGGHLSSLVALTENRYQETLQPGFEEADTSVQGCLPMYGVYDFCPRNPQTITMAIDEFLAERNLMPMRLEEDPDFWDMMSPVAQVHPKRPPFMVTNGINDTLTLVENARFFIDKMRSSGGDEPLVYVEVEKAPHGFDIFYTPRCIAAVNALHVFSEYLYSNYLKTAKAA
jgi:acetyl esterase/lipase